MIGNIDATILTLSAQDSGWTTITGPMSLAARALAQRGYGDVCDDAAPVSIRFRPNYRGRAAAQPSN